MYPAQKVFPKWYAGLSLALSVVMLVSCRPSQAPEASLRNVDSAFASYISSYTTGTVSSRTAIRVMLGQPYGDSSIINRETALKLFRLEPVVSGSTFWLDNRTVEFRPTDRLKAGQLYKVTFALSELFDVPQSLSTFTFSLQVLRQDFELTIDHLYSTDRNDLAQQRLEGLLQTADVTDAGQSEKMLTAMQDGKPLSITWTHSKDELEHRFMVAQIIRDQQASSVQIFANGEVLGVNRRQTREIEVPALGDFKLTQARVMPGSNQHVILSFSDPLNEKQNLDGLIRLGKLSDLQFNIKDHEIFVYPNVRQTDSMMVYLEPGIRNVLDKRLEKGSSIMLQFEQPKPAVRFTSSGNILPGTDLFVLPFEAVGLRAVDLQVVKIFEENMLQFLQANQLDGSNELRRVGKVILKKMIKLDESGMTDFEKWNRYTLDLATLMNAEPGAIYQVRLGFNQNYSTYFCTDQALQSDLPPLLENNWEGPDNQEFSYWDSYDNDFYNPDYDWQERDNPCHSSYYSSSRRISKNILASDLGIMAKRGDESTLRIFISSISTTLPLSNVKVEAYNFQKQLLATAQTDSEGKIILNNLTEKPFVLVANDGNQRGYLRIDDGSSLSLSAFDVSGQTVENGIKGFIYGDRGVWRPGDSLHISFILEDKNDILPDDHPVIFELNNPQNQSVDRQVQKESVNGIYYFGSVTDPEAITGNYLARVRVGGTTFSQNLKVETVKPNRLKIQLELDGDQILAGKNNVKGNLDVKWLHGAPARNLMAEFELLLSRHVDPFPTFSDYTFSDPTVGFNESPIAILKERLDANGHLNVNATLDNPEAAPGVLNATFRGKVFEAGGDFSIDRFTIPFYTYPTFIGIRSPKGDVARSMLLTDTLHRIDIVRVDPEGVLNGNGKVTVEVHKLEWTWWWENTGSDIANYVTSTQSEPLQKQTVSLVNGKGRWNFKIEYPDWGRYFLRVCDPVSGHCTGKVVYVDWPGWAGRAQRDGAEGATMLMLSSDKSSYQTGDEAVLQIPGSAGAKALISIENGSRVLQTTWLPTQSGDTPFRFMITEEMSPNVYVYVTLLQQHTQTTNDLPIRLYGIIPIKVEDAKTHLKPEIKLPDELQPGKEVVIRISESEKRKMSYTVAVVDEGLLDLTRFQTPDPWNRFYAREALGVRTWDLYDQVIGSYGRTLERLLAVGGDETQLIPKDSDARAQRFKPVVKFLGPFTLEPGKTNTHKFIMPAYIGSVKTMVVAAFEGAYGQAEQVSAVRESLMVLGTLPRVLGPLEELKLPVTLFAGDVSVKTAKVQVTVSGPIKLPGSASREISFEDKSDLTTYFDLSVADETGVGKISIVATSGSHRAQHEIEVEVRNPLLPATQITEVRLEAGQSWDAVLETFGAAGSNRAMLEVSAIPPINLEARLAYLLNYPHGCLEQLTSTAFPQLYVSELQTLTESQSSRVQEHIKTAIQKLTQLQNRDGGFSYWPGASPSDYWGTTYAGHFLVEAEKKGYVVSSEVMRKWRRFQKSRVSEWRKDPQSKSGDLQQAYRLYALALSGSAENGAMNRLRETPNLQPQASWMLAAAYATVGQIEAAKQLINQRKLSVDNYADPGDTYGSSLRDQAILLETLALLEDETAGLELFHEIAKALGTGDFWMSTQTTAFCLKAVANFTRKIAKVDELVFSYTMDASTPKEVRTSLPLAALQLDLPEKTGSRLKLQNLSNGVLFARVIMIGTPTRPEEDVAIERNLRIQAIFTDGQGHPIDISAVEQGTTFYSEITVQHLGLGAEYDNLALSEILPSGWEINNSRLDPGAALKTDSDFNYQDIRDDRVLTYFSLKPGQSKVFRTLITAAYAGKYYLPGPHCEAMYDHNIQAKSKGKEVQVTAIKEVY